MTKETYQMIVNRSLSWINRSELKISISVKNVRGGRAWYDTKEIEMPLWINNFDVIYQIYYIIHELVHCLTGHKHDKDFKLVEDCLLRMWGIEIKRKRVYPKELKFNGKIVTNIPSF